jgi:hypothetical protein
MNERIRQLAEQVYGTQATEQEIKFAELIVRECMSNLYLNGYDDAMMQIKQHFGVKE